MYKDTLDSDCFESSLSDYSLIGKVRETPSKNLVRVSLRSFFKLPSASGASIESMFDDFGNEEAI